MILIYIIVYIGSFLLDLKYTAYVFKKILFLLFIHGYMMISANFTYVIKLNLANYFINFSYLNIIIRTNLYESIIKFYEKCLKII